MQSILLIVCLILSTLTFAEQTTIIGNLTVKIHDGREDWIKVYKNNKVVLREECRGILCEIYIVNSKTKDFRFEDGMVKPDGKTAFNLSTDNIKIFKDGWFNQNNVIGFVQTTTGATGIAGSRDIYIIDIDSGDLSIIEDSHDYYPR